MVGSIPADPVSSPYRRYVPQLDDGQLQNTVISVPRRLTCVDRVLPHRICERRILWPHDGLLGQKDRDCSILTRSKQ